MIGSWRDNGGTRHSTVSRRQVWLPLAAFACVLCGCATPPADESRSGDRALSIDKITIDRSAYTAHWYRPTVPPTALIVFQPGFSRRCANLRSTTDHLVRTGVIALCLDASMARGNHALADSLARILAHGLTMPDGRTLPDRIIVAGHSAGAAFAARLGMQLSHLAPARLAGALLFDPVAAQGFTDDINAISSGGRRPVRAVIAQSDGCNANLNALQALRDVRLSALHAGRDGFVGVQLIRDSTHVDVEGEDSDWIGILACGRPLPANVALLRQLATQWLVEMTGGAEFRGRVFDGARPIE